MGSIQQSLNGSCPYLTRHSFLVSFFALNNRNKTQTSKWQRAQDPRKPRRVAQTFLPCSHKGKSKNSRKPLVSCTLNPPAQLTSHKWSHSSPKRWLEVPMMTTPSLNLLMHSKSMAKLMQKCSSIHS